jgi:hypothetical protein
MFTLCNDIAYNGIMVNGVNRRLDDPEKPDRFDGPDGPAIWPSGWVDEPARTPGTHLQGDQISRMESALAYLKTQGIDPGEVIAISPFRAVTQKLEELSKRPEYRGLLPARSMPPRGGKQPLYSWSLAATRHRCESVGGVDRQPRQRGR